MLKISEIKDLISTDKTSERKQRAKKGDEYYNALHDIRYYKMYYYNADGELVEVYKSGLSLFSAFSTSCFVVSPV